MAKRHSLYSLKKKKVTHKSKTRRMCGGSRPINNNINRAYPASGPASNGFNFIVPQIAGNGIKHRTKCKCSTCKIKHMKIKGGGSCSTSNGGLPYPNGLLGQPWTSNAATWPGVDGISMNRNYLPYNNLDTVDLKTNQLNIGAQPPFTYFGGNKKKTKKNKHIRSQQGGWGSFIRNDIINVARQIPYNIGSVYNGITGYSAPVNPLPYKDQLTRDTIKV